MKDDRAYLDAAIKRFQARLRTHNWSRTNGSLTRLEGDTRRLLRAFEWVDNCALDARMEADMGNAYINELSAERDSLRASLHAAEEALLALVEYVEDENPGAALGGDAYVTNLCESARAALLQGADK